MRFYADLHVHSKYSRATSRDADLEHLALWARRKGITVVGTGDFTHPAWFEEIREKLVPAEPGLFRLRPEIEREVERQLPASCHGPTRFLLEVEISTIYKKGDRTRKVHHLIYAANLETAGRFREKLATIGNISSDGRPILGLDSRHLLEIALASGPDAYLIPAHIWTPWFAALGSKSGFDSIDECYGDLAPHIFAVETGLSSDPPMNWRVSQLDRFTLVSNSDAHSPPKLGREACAFDTDLDYFAIRRALETGEGYGGTVEFFPEEGKYHLDGHRACGVRLEPPETRRLEGRCPSCGKPLTVGVMHRVEELADRPEDAAPPRPVPFRSLVQLPEILGEIRGVGPKALSVEAAASQLVGKLGPEIDILERLPLEDVERAGGGLLREALFRLREGRVLREAGYDGEYGVIRLFAPDEIRGRGLVGSLFESASPGGPVEGRLKSVGSDGSDGSVGFVRSVRSGIAPAAGEASPLDPEQAAAAAIV
ncbi:MAG TPA: endonuclease Q family protein, partial [Thermoanaerobaculia bacterium]